MRSSLFPTTNSTVSVGSAVTMQWVIGWPPLANRSLSARRLRPGCHPEAITDGGCEAPGIASIMREPIAAMIPHVHLGEGALSLVGDPSDAEDDRSTHSRGYCSFGWLTPRGVNCASGSLSGISKE